MPVIPPEFVSCPFPANPSRLLDKVSRSQGLWSYQQLRALQDKVFTSNQLFHIAYHKPIISLSYSLPSPIQVATEHYFEQSYKDSNFTIMFLCIIISPAFYFFEPDFRSNRNSYESHPTILPLAQLPPSPFLLCSRLLGEHPH